MLSAPKHGRLLSRPARATHFLSLSHWAARANTQLSQSWPSRTKWLCLGLARACLVGGVAIISQPDSAAVELEPSDMAV